MIVSDNFCYIMTYTTLIVICFYMFFTTTIVRSYVVLYFIFPYEIPMRSLVITFIVLMFLAMWWALYQIKRNTGVETRSTIRHSDKYPSNGDDSTRKCRLYEREKWLVQSVAGRQEVTRETYTLMQWDDCEGYVSRGIVESVGGSK